MGWRRYEIVRTLPDSVMVHRVGTSRWRWRANWVAARHIQRRISVGGDLDYEVREIAPRVQPDYWPRLQVLQASRWYPIPTAMVTSGSVVVHTSVGISRWHALGRAVRWAQPRSVDQVQIARWSGEHSRVPTDSEQKQ